MTHTLHLGDCRAVLTTMPDDCIDSIVTDPPYELGFMGKSWDASGIAYDVTMWRQCLRVLKPGGHLLSFGGSRTYHRMAVAIEDAGFEIRDQMQWIYGSGFPKSHNLRGEYQGFGTALKPAHEPIVAARKPLTGTVADNVRQWGTGAINIDGTRIGDASDMNPRDFDDTKRKSPKFNGQSYNNGRVGEYRQKIGEIPPGRWPANVLFDEDAAEALDAQSGVSASSKPSSKIPYGNKENTNANLIYGKGLATTIPNVAPYGDTGGASRFFYIAKASRTEREAGLEGREVKNNMRVNAPRESEEEKHATQRANHHPTVKPIALMRYLVRLVTPPRGTVLDPFTGSGTTGCAAALEGFAFVGIEQSAEYLAIAEARIAHHSAQPKLEL